jgi:putative DNA primase/helicase
MNTTEKKGGRSDSQSKRRCYFHPQKTTIADGLRQLASEEAAERLVLQVIGRFKPKPVECWIPRSNECVGSITWRRNLQNYPQHPLLFNMARRGSGGFEPIDSVSGVDPDKLPDLSKLQEQQETPLSSQQIIKKLYLLVPGAVLLPIPLGEKGPKDPGWQNRRFDETQSAEYQWKLSQAVERGGNIGVLLGPASNRLVALDVDEDNLVAEFLRNHPWLQNTLRTRGSRGCQFWLRLEAGCEFPNRQAVYSLKRIDGQPYGELRLGGAGGAQSIIWGLHPKRMRYSIVIDAQILEISLADLYELCPSLNTDETEFTPEPDDDELLFKELVERYDAAVYAFGDFKILNIPPRQLLMGRWMKEGDTGFIYGERGAGKTWLVDALAAALSSGRELFDWKTVEAVNVLFVDGEMAYDDSRDRLAGLGSSDTALYLLHHETLFAQTGLVLNLADERIQRIVTEICERRAIKVMILDNLSCLCSGVKENEALDWEKILPWILDLRRRRVTVIFVHHAGVSGRMRGTTKREDHALWVLRVEETKGRAAGEEGASFDVIFKKQRNSSAIEWNVKASFKTEADGSVSIGWEGLSFEGKIFELIKDGLTSASDIAEELGVAKSTVSKTVKRLIDKKLIEIRNRQYVVRGVLDQDENGDKK